MSIAAPIITIGFRTSGYGAGELDFSINTEKLKNLSQEDFELIKGMLTDSIPNSVSLLNFDICHLFFMVNQLSGNPG